MTIGQEAAGHWEQLWTEMEMAVAAFPDELWTRALCGNQAWWGKPCYVAHHMVWCMALEHLLRVPLEEMPHNVFPEYDRGIAITKRQVLDILADIRSHCRDRYRDMTDEEYATADDRGMTPIGRVMYALAHTRQHYGQLVQILRENGIEGPGWYPLAGE